MESRYLQDFRGLVPGEVSRVFNDHQEIGEPDFFKALGIRQR